MSKYVNERLKKRMDEFGEYSLFTLSFVKGGGSEVDFCLLCSLVYLKSVEKGLAHNNFFCRVNIYQAKVIWTLF